MLWFDFFRHYYPGYERPEDHEQDDPFQEPEADYIEPPPKAGKTRSRNESFTRRRLSNEIPVHSHGKPGENRKLLSLSKGNILKFTIWIYTKKSFPKIAYYLEHKPLWTFILQLPRHMLVGRVHRISSVQKARRIRALWVFWLEVMKEICLFCTEWCFTIVVHPKQHL